MALDRPELDSADETALCPWGRVQAEAMDRLARYSKMALDAGATEKQSPSPKGSGANRDVLRSVFE